MNFKDYENKMTIPKKDDYAKVYAYKEGKVVFDGSRTAPGWSVVNMMGPSGGNTRNVQKFQITLEGNK